MDKLSSQPLCSAALVSKELHDKAAIKQEQNDACISSAEREQARRSANMATIQQKSENISKAVLQLQELLKGIEE